MTYIVQYSFPENKGRPTRDEIKESKQFKTIQEAQKHEQDLRLQFRNRCIWLNIIKIADCVDGDYT